MEAAFAYFDHYGAGSTFTGRRVEIAAAVDAAYRYSLAVDQELPPNAMIRIFP
jgi:hypothetical protein